MAIFARCDGCGHESEGIGTPYKWGTLKIPDHFDKHFCPTCIEIISKPFPAGMGLVRVR